MSSDHSMFSNDRDTEKDQLFVPRSCGRYKIKYQRDDDWDFHLDNPSTPIDVSLSLPHYRARYQPVDHRMNLFVGGDSAPLKVKLCRPQPRIKFYLEIQAGTSDVSVWLPSNFKGQIHYSGKASFSAGFTNSIMRNARLNEGDYVEDYAEDVVVVVTCGRITFRMWDVHANAPENTHKEAFKRMFGCMRRAPETTVDWDFLLED